MKKGAKDILHDLGITIDLNFRSSIVIRLGQRQNDWNRQKHWWRMQSIDYDEPNSRIDRKEEIEVWI